MTRVEKTVFLSYRRSDVGLALAIYNALTLRGFDVFFDYRWLGSGSFETAISENIKARAHFLVFLTPVALLPRDEEIDWFRRRWGRRRVFNIQGTLEINMSEMMAWDHSGLKIYSC
jgi:hypothetical protein